MPNQDGGMPLHAEYRDLPVVPPDPVDQVVTGSIPDPSPYFQTPAALDLLNEPVCVVTGQPGVGKTQIAAAYARRRRKDGWLVAWISAETAVQLEAGLVELADQLGLYQPDVGTGIVLARVRNHLHTRSGSALLVFDNVESLDVVRPHLPSSGSCQVVITSTARGSRLRHEVPVEVFTPEAASRFLCEATGLDDAATAAELAAELGHLPLALAQAAARIRIDFWDFAGYLEAFRNFPVEEQLGREDDPYPVSVVTAILLALEPFRGSTLVPLLGVLSPDGVPRRLLQGFANDELRRLRRASLVEFAGRSSVLMHRLVQRVVRDRVSGVGLAAKLLLDHVEFGDAWQIRHRGNELVQQIDALWANTDPAAAPEVTKRVLLLRVWQAGFLGSAANFSRGRVIAEEAYAQAAARLGDDEELLLLCRQVLSTSVPTGSEDLLPQLRIDLGVSRETRGAEDPATLTAARLLGTYCAQHGHAEEAVSVLEEALEPWLDKPLQADEHFGALDDLAWAYLLAGRAEEAVAVLDRSLDARPDALYTKTLLDTAYTQLGRHADARRLCEEIWDAYRKTAGPDHPNTLFAGAKLGTALFLNGERDLAWSLLLVVRAIGTDLLGPDHLLVTTAEGALQIIRQD
ncbi:tetratricopeptide repeat protein [Lentzea sp. NPDC058436]|uniref:tetratricopeptide repeat protein n=1 Tax=Lentzea sp. NPDC058436 TaxID=3346499 RepID=UPI003658DC0E